MSASEPVDLVVVSGEPLWPPHHGGRIRGAHLVEELSRSFRVLTVAPVEGRPPDRHKVEPLPDEVPPGRLAAVANLRPRLGRALLGPSRLAALRAVVVRERPSAVLFASGYLAAMATGTGVPVAVDFVDLDVRRMASLARIPGTTVRSRVLAGAECLKAWGWEPAVARRAVVVSAPSADDVRRLTFLGATAVHVPNGADRVEMASSPPCGPVMFAASFGYPPNAAAARFVLEEVWPLLRRSEPKLRLRLVGRDASRVIGPVVPTGVEVISDPGEMDDLYRDASVVLAPVRAGGGSQLKVSEALAHGRTVVATSYSARTAAPLAGGGVLVADDALAFADGVLHLWRDLAARRVGEKSLAEACPVPTWEEACAPLIDALQKVVRPE